ncbi:hypothetical protein PR002_g22078 [Phytophthora rubi]|uniref:Uncharacterized protein n=1 Tax=Phytophthora rubi TaxID=129364 RepID=A0A6A3IZ64_9STRA|nr:hypothetical protein PR002_g22078 [Phytophthora rubi]
MRSWSQCGCRRNKDSRHAAATTLRWLQPKPPAPTLTPTPKPAPDTPKTPPAVTPDTSESKPTKCHGAPDPKQAPMPEPTTSPVQNPKKPTTPTQKPGHISAKRVAISANVVLPLDFYFSLTRNSQW